MNSPGDNDPVFDLLEHLDGRLKGLSSRPEEGPRSLAAAGLARSVALLDGARTLARSGRPDLYGVFTRLVWECWLVGAYLIVGGSSALDEIKGSFGPYAKSVRGRLPDYPLPSFEEYDSKRIIWEQFEIKVNGFLEDRGIQVETGTYETLYRHESTMDSHAGWGSFARYLDRSEDGRWLVDPIGQPTLPVDQHEAITALYVADLAKLVLGAFGFDVSRVASIRGRLRVMAFAKYPDDVRLWSVRAYPFLGRDGP